MISKKLRELRKESGFSQKQISEKLGISLTGYASWEQGLSQPNIDYVKKLCLIYDISADELLFEESSSPQEEKKYIIPIASASKDDRPIQHKELTQEQFDKLLELLENTPQLLRDEQGRVYRGIPKKKDNDEERE